MVRHHGTESGKKRVLDELNKNLEYTDTKRIKLEEDRARRELAIMNAKSSHQNLVDLKLQEQEDKYFSLLEKKKAMEEKMRSFVSSTSMLLCQRLRGAKQRVILSR